MKDILPRCSTRVPPAAPKPGEGGRFVAVDDEVVVQPHLVREALVPFRHQFVMLDGQMIILNQGFAFEIERGHREKWFARAFNPVWLTVSKGCRAKINGTCLLTSHSGTSMPLEERFGHAPAGAYLQALSSKLEIASFDVDSSRSYAKFIL